MGNDTESCEMPHERPCMRLSPLLTLWFRRPSSLPLLQTCLLGAWGWTGGSRLQVRKPRPSAFVLWARPGPGRGPGCVPVQSHRPQVTALFPLSVSGRSVDPGLAGLLGRRAPRSKQPFMVTFFRESPNPTRVPRAVRSLRRRLPKKTNELPQPHKLPGIFGEAWQLGSEAHRLLAWGQWW